jgi:uncharacterized protein
MIAIKNTIITTIIVGLTIALLLIILPWSRVNWGQLQLAPASTVTVTGQSESQEQNQVARFTAGVTAVGNNKQAVVEEVNQQITEIIEAVKIFGIPAEDIRTENLSIYQEEDYDQATRRVSPGQWRANNSISIKLTAIERADDLTNLLTQSGATNIFGPNFSLENTQSAQIDLVNQAIENARAKADAIAQASGRQLGKVLSVAESGATSPIPFYGLEARGMGGGADLQPGSSTVFQSVTVTFELK